MKLNVLAAAISISRHIDTDSAHVSSPSSSSYVFLCFWCINDTRTYLRSALDSSRFCFFHTYSASFFLFLFLNLFYCFPKNSCTPQFHIQNGKTNLLDSHVSYQINYLWTKNKCWRQVKTSEQGCSRSDTCVISLVCLQFQRYPRGLLLIYLTP